jgi:membrane protein DedA with SNARE-associated domain
MLVASLTHSITNFIGNHGIYAVFLLMLIDAVFPAASELVMVYAGALAAAAFSGQHVVLFGDRIHSHFWGFVVMSIAGTLGYTVGAIGGWAVGAWGGRPLLERYGRYVHLGPETLAKADAWFGKHGDSAVFIGRITPVVRSFVSLPAGALRMPFVSYTWLTLLGSTLWCLVFAGIGLGAGTGYRHFHHAFGYAEIVIVAVVVVAAGWLVLRWWRKRSSTLGARGKDPAR